MDFKKIKKYIKNSFVPNEDGKKNNVGATIIIFLAILPLILFEGIKFGILAGKLGSTFSTWQILAKGFSTSFIGVLGIKQGSSNFGGSGFSPLYLIGFLMVYAAAFALAFISADRNKNKSSKKDGDMEFEDIDEFNDRNAYKNENNEIAEPEENSKDTGNMIISERIRYNLAGGGTRYSCALVVGATGSGKSFTYVKPNLMQLNSSYIVTDPKGELTRDTGQMMMRHGYNVKVLNTDQDQMEYSCRYNPFKYIRGNEGVISLVQTFMDNTKQGDADKEDPFFGPAEKNFYLMLFFYVYTVYKNEPEKQTFKTIYEMYQLADEPETRPGQKNTKNKFDEMFETLAKEDPTNPALGYYSTFKKGSPKTKQSILISAGVRLWFMSSPKVANLLSDDEFELETIGDRKTVVYVIMKAEDPTFKFISAMFFSQLFKILYYTGNSLNEKTWMLTYGNCTALRSDTFIAGTPSEQEAKRKLEEKRALYLESTIETDDENDERFKTANEYGIVPWPKSRIVTKDGTVLKEYNSRAEAELIMNAIKNGTIHKGKKSLTCHTRFMLDEFANIGKIADFDKMLATFRSLRISADIIVQSKAQLQEMYEDHESKIISNCSIINLLGTNDLEDCKWMSELLGQTTVRSQSTNIDNKGLMVSASGGQLSDNAQNLMRPEQIRSMDPNQCLVVVQGEKPLKDKKYKALNHPRWGETLNSKDDSTLCNEFQYQRIFFIEQKDDAMPSVSLESLQNRDAQAQGLTDKRRNMDRVVNGNPHMLRSNRDYSEENSYINKYAPEINKRTHKIAKSLEDKDSVKQAIDKISKVIEENKSISKKDLDSPSWENNVNDKVQKGILKEENKKITVANALADFTDL